MNTRDRRKTKAPKGYARIPVVQSSTAWTATGIPPALGSSIVTFPVCDGATEIDVGDCDLMTCLEIGPDALAAMDAADAAYEEKLAADLARDDDLWIYADEDMSRPVTTEEWERTRDYLAALPKLQDPPPGYWNDLAGVAAHWPTLPESQDSDTEPLI